MADGAPVGDGHEPLTAEERVDRGVREAERDYRSDQVDQKRGEPAPVRESGGGGAGGGYAYTPESLALIIAQWKTRLQEIVDDDSRLRDAHELANPPAEDGPSVRQARAYKEWIAGMIGHNESMRRYAESYLEKLTATQRGYQDAESDAVSGLRHAGDQ